MTMNSCTYGAHIFLWVERWSDEHLDLIDRAAALGLGCLEIAVGDEVVCSAANARARAEACGIELIVSPGGEWPMDCDISRDDFDERARGLAWHRREIERAAEFGAIAYTGALYGHPGNVARRIPPADELPRTAEGLHTLATRAAELGITLALEPMSHFRTHLVNTPAQAMRLIDLADHPNLFVLFDTYHMVTEVRDYAAAIATLAPRLWGIHACENDRGVPGGGLVPWESLFRALHAARFAGHILLETYNSSLGDFAERRGMFHGVCPDGDVFVRDGLAHLEGVRKKTGE
jgi:D-psicose/D-tagatose/L-ribulose 3-epimerase